MLIRIKHENPIRITGDKIKRAIPRLSEIDKIHTSQNEINAGSL